MLVIDEAVVKISYVQYFKAFIINSTYYFINTLVLIKAKAIIFN